MAAWTGIAGLRSHEARITFLDVGKGDAALIELPGGRTALIDAGEGGEEGRFDMGRNVVAPYLWNKGVRAIDAVIVTHLHSDHLGGAIYILENFKVGTVIDNGASDDSELYKKYARLIKEKKVRRSVVGEGDMIELSPDGKFLVLSPREDSPFSDANASSLVGKFVFGKGSVLFCGDATGVAMDAMLDSYPDLLASDIMKAPHHGGNAGEYSTINAFYSKASPKVIIISTGRQRRYDKRHINAITYSNAICYDTSKNGAIIATIKSTGYSTKPFLPVN